MSNNAMQLAKHKTELLTAALELYKGNRLDAGYVKAEADAEKMFKKEMAKLRKKEKEASGKALSEKLQQVEDLNLTGEAYEKIAVFDSYEEAQGALWDKGGWVTSKSGRRGSTKTRSYHGGEKGKYKITCDKNGDGTAYLWAATTNDTSLSSPSMISTVPRSWRTRARRRTILGRGLITRQMAQSRELIPGRGLITRQMAQMARCLVATACMFVARCVAWQPQRLARRPQRLCDRLAWRPLSLSP